MYIYFLGHDGEAFNELLIQLDCKVINAWDGSKSFQVYSLMEDPKMKTKDGIYELSLKHAAIAILISSVLISGAGLAGITERVSVDSAGNQANGGHK